MTFLEKWFEEVWNQGRTEAIDAMMAPEARTHGLEHPDGTAVDGSGAFKAFHKQLCSSFSEIHVDVTHTISGEDLTAACCVVTALHTGDGLGVPATGKKVTFTGMCMVRLQDGRAVEAWNNFDLNSMYQQLQ
ncbi:ester cyclase [Edaphobacter sp. 12200R-103]|uniref:ester cyclase n=1 Tax=Edaphobacter sp. 12200R-103 TaxID=2703788 RepID=UPI00138D885A|nr:ester cyclase [Edaphobacter sp. 12200R-103]QHS52189.1 ester cyclase [Edaphobacter sp. 12200R-103]